MLSIPTDPKNRPGGPTREPAPVPVLVRAPGAVADLGWTAATGPTRDALVQGLAPVMAKDGLILEGLELSGRVAIVRIRNTRYGSTPQAVGRTGRLLSNVLPASIEEIRVVPMEQGLPGAQVVLRRSALERFENAFEGSDAMLAATKIEDAAGVDRRAGLNTEFYGDFTWRFGPYVRAALFDPTNPLRADLGAELAAEWNPTPGVYISGLMRKKIVGNLNTSTRASDSVLPHVRSDANVYDRDGDPSLDHLTAAYFFRPGRNLYGRVTAGYLERMYGGVSAELLWKPVNSRLALGVEINGVKQRSFDDMLGFKPHDTNPLGTNTRATLLQPLNAYPVKSYETITGHVSAYYAFGNGFHGQLDVGRYLAKDWGATFALDREFKNGWKVGAYATLTDVSSADFGEGSFDKGIRLTIPLGWQLGSPSRRTSETVIQPLLRDGGARLQVQDRLYEGIRNTHRPQLEARWGKFWR